MVRSHIVRTVLSDIEVTPKVARGEIIQAVRVILGRSKPAEISARVFRALPRDGSEPSYRERIS